MQTESEWLNEKLTSLEEKYAQNPFAEDTYTKEALKAVKLWYGLVLTLRITVTLIPVINLIVIGLFKFFTDKSWLKIDAVKQLKILINDKQNNKNFVKLDGTQVTLNNKLGQGVYGVVYHATHNNRVVAAKISVGNTGPKLLHKLAEDLEREGEFLSRINSHYVVQCFGYFIAQQNAGILIEYVPHGTISGGTLTALIQSNKVLTWNHQSRISREVALGFNALHQANIVHSDPKTDNILVYSEEEKDSGNIVWHIKISDLGLSHITEENVKRGTAHWWAPEVFQQGQGTTTESDVYALGLIYWSVVSRESPFKHYVNNDGQAFMHDLTIRPPIGQKFKEVPQRYAHLVQWCWNQEPTDRPSCVEILDELNDIQASTSQLALTSK